MFQLEKEKREKYKKEELTLPLPWYREKMKMGRQLGKQRLKSRPTRTGDLPDKWVGASSGGRLSRAAYGYIFLFWISKHKKTSKNTRQKLQDRL